MVYYVNTMRASNEDIHALTWEDTIGSTPLVSLPTLSEETSLRVYAKLEMLNPGGSMKDRPALKMIQDALQKGLVKIGGTVVESSSGNMGVGLAQVCSHYGIKFICIVDNRTNVANIKLMQAFGAQVEVITKPYAGMGLLDSRLKRVHEILKEVPGSFWTDQYSNENNASAHEETCKEIFNSLDAVDYIFCATGTCGTIRGCSDYIKKNSLPTSIIGVDAVGSVIFGGDAGSRLIPGHGSARRPALYKEDMADQVIYADDSDCVKGCYALLDKETILAGGSSGAIVSAFLKSAHTFPRGSSVVLLLPDRGERYLDTIYNEEWVKDNKLDGDR